MPKLPIVNAKQVIKALETIDFQIVRQRGSHIQMKHEDGRFVTIPSHSSQTIGKGLLLKILRDAVKYD